MRRIILTIVILGSLSLAPFLIKGADLQYHHYPRLANLFFRWDITADEAKDLAKWDMLIIDMEVQTYSPASLALIKKINPNIKLLAYLAPQEIRGDSGTLTGTLRQKLYKKINSKWWLKNSSGGSVAWWAPNPMINVTADAPSVGGKRWQNVLAEFVRDDLLATGYWDGVFYDNVWQDLNFMNGYNIDLNQDGSAESMSQVNQKWKAGMTSLLQTTRNTLGSEALIVGNGGETFYKYINGSLYEHFPVKGWAEMMKKYKFITEEGYQPAVGILNTNVNNTGKKNDYKKMRYGLTSALMYDGYHTFDNGDQSHREIWWYDEYEASLGEPAGEPKNLTASSTKIKEGLWRRDYKNGLVLVNSTNSEKIIELGGEYEKLRGTQDSYTNDGLFVEEVAIPAKDGLILLRPLANIFNATYVNGSFARVFNQYGNVARSGFFAYNELFTGSSQVIEQDLDGDGVKEFVVSNVNRVQIFNQSGSIRTTFYPYTAKYDKGVNITVGDLDNNGTLEIITGTENGGGPHIRIFNSDGKLINPGFFAYGPEFRGGVNVTVADLNGDGWKSIIAGAGVGGGPHVRVFSGDGRLINPGFFAYDPAFRGGVNVAAGDIDGDGIDEIVTGPGKGGSPQVKSFNEKGQKDGPEFYAFDESGRGGVEVAVTDMDADGKDEIIATTSDVFTIAGY